MMVAIMRKGRLNWIVVVSDVDGLPVCRWASIASAAGRRSVSS